jgi:hypothetical protein
MVSIDFLKIWLIVVVCFRFVYTFQKWDEDFRQNGMITFEMQLKVKYHLKLLNCPSFSVFIHYLKNNLCFSIKVLLLLHYYHCRFAVSTVYFGVCKHIHLIKFFWFSWWNSYGMINHQTYVSQFRLLNEFQIQKFY